MSGTVGFGDDFEALLAEAEAIAPVSQRKEFVKVPRQDRLPSNIQRVKYAKKGSFIFKSAGKRGVDIERNTKELSGVLLGIKLGRQQWVRSGDKAELRCSTVTHTYNDKEVLGGWWDVPLHDDAVDKLLNPIGSKNMDGKKVLMSCVECKAQKLNEGCKTGGVAYFYVTACELLNQETEMQEMTVLPKPVLLALSLGSMSNRALLNYITFQLKRNGVKADDVVTRISLAPVDNLPDIYNLKLEMDEPVGNQRADGYTLLETLTAIYKAAEEKRIEEWKKNNPLPGKGAKALKGINLDDIEV